MAQPIWNTPAGSLGSYPSEISMVLALSASPILPAVSITYTLLSGSLPLGLILSNEGIISGVPNAVAVETTSQFAVRVTDNLGSIRDRTFTLSVTGSAIPQFTTPSGSLLSTNDSIWIELPIDYSNPNPNNPIIISLLEGRLPPGLEVNSEGIIRGYPEPPTVNVTLPVVTTAATVTETTNVITCLSTSGFTPGRPVTFTGTTVFGGIEEGVTYYIRTINNSTGFTISSTPNGSVLNLTSGTGFMTVTLAPISVGQPTIRTYNFTLRLDSPAGSDINAYSITVLNQNTPTSQGGPGRPSNSRVPVILNTRPETFNITDSNIYQGYYVLPPAGSGYDTYPLDTTAFIGTVENNNFFAFKIIGKDFDNNELTYVFSGLPIGLVGNSNTGWITGTPAITSEGINQYEFSAAVYKTGNPTIQSPFIKFSFNLANSVTGDITWVTPSSLGSIFNGTISTKSVRAISDVELEYRVTAGELPPNLTLLPNGQITGYVASQPTSTLLNTGARTEFSFTIEAFSPLYPIVKSEKRFSITIVQEYQQPTDILYIKAAPSIQDREVIDSLLTDTALIPTEYLYRPDDIYFGKASSVIYEHAYGIFSSDINEYLTAVTKNHYWRNITLGSLKTAQAKDDQGNVIYEVVFSQVVDNLQNPSGTSISEQIYWPRPINLFLGPWYTSVTNIFTSYDNNLGQEYFTSLTPGYARTLYPNSLHNMRTRIGQELGQEYDSRLLPLWMTSQQVNGSTLGYTQAWVICYTLPSTEVNFVAGYNQKSYTLPFEPVTKNQLTITISGQLIDSAGYSIIGNTIIFSSYPATGSKIVVVANNLSEIIKNNIEKNWRRPDGLPHKLNNINFKIDRFSVNKSITYDFDNNTSPPAWTGLPSATPVPDPIDSKDFYVLFPRQNILPNKTQY